tara:strand:+ start:4111 stop:4890 length:780 start_codon:yes stop_codon:yes gene_type:complete
MFRKKTQALHFAVDDHNAEGLTAHKDLVHRYGSVDMAQADVIVALGGDGFMLHTLHHAMALDIPVFGMNLGSIGFLMNDYNTSPLLKRIEDALSVVISPLRMDARYCSEGSETFYALNEVSLLRQLHQAAKIRIHVDGRVRLEKLMGDGIIVATAAGSTAYNFSASGPILPITSNLITMTPISPFRPRRWRGALLPDDVSIRLEVLESAKRPVSVSADYQEARNVCAVDICKAKNKTVTLLYDSHQTLAERIIAEQFES